MSIDYRKKVEELVIQVSSDRMIEVNDLIKRLRTKGRTYEWIYTALSSKPMKIWNEKGFGLILSADYQTEIDNKIAAKAAKDAKINKTQKDEQRYYEAYDKYYDIWWNKGKSFTEKIPVDTIPNELDVFNKNYNPNVNFHFYGPYQDNESGEWFYYFGTFEGYDKFRIRNGWEKPPQKVTIYVDTYWDGEGRLVEKGKLWDIR